MSNAANSEYNKFRVDAARDRYTRTLNSIVDTLRSEIESMEREVKSFEEWDGSDSSVLLGRFTRDIQKRISQIPSRTNVADLTIDYMEMVQAEIGSTGA